MDTPELPEIVEAIGKSARQIVECSAAIAGAQDEVFFLRRTPNGMELVNALSGQVHHEIGSAMLWSLLKKDVPGNADELERVRLFLVSQGIVPQQAVLSSDTLPDGSRIVGDRFEQIVERAKDEIGQRAGQEARQLTEALSQLAGAYEALVEQYRKALRDEKEAHEQTLMFVHEMFETLGSPDEVTHG